MAKSKAKTKQSTVSKKPDALPEDPATATGSQRDYDAFLPQATALAASEVIAMRADPQLALHNIQIGVASVLAESARLAKLPETKAKEIAALPSNALAVIFASTQIAPPGATEGLAAKVSHAMSLRALLLKTADALVLAGLLPKAEVDKIRAGHGKLDGARDLVALTALYAKHAAKVRGKHAVSAAQIKEAASVGTELLTLLKPGRARPSSRGAKVGADERDRLWTLLVQGHDRLWRAGAYLFGRSAVDAKVPALQASRGSRAKNAAAGPAITPPTPGLPSPATP